MISIILRIIAILLLFWALDKHPYGYYQLLRWITFGTGVYSALIAFSLGKKSWIWIFGITALIFNPFIPFYFKRDTWQIIDVIAGVIFLVSIFVVREKT